MTRKIPEAIAFEVWWEKRSVFFKGRVSEQDAYSIWLASCSEFATPYQIAFEKAFELVDPAKRAELLERVGMVDIRLLKEAAR